MRKIWRNIAVASILLLVISGGAFAEPPGPLLEKGSDPVDWWFVFKFNATSFPFCAANVQRQCIFGGDVQKYGRFSQQYVYATNEDPTLKAGGGCLGDTTTDPVGATFDQVFNGAYFYVIWNDQFYLDPRLHGCGNSCSGPWGHSKGLLAWDESGAGFLMQVTTPNWPGAGEPVPARARGNTLGCLTQAKGTKVIPQNNIVYSQHFFALRLTKDDLALVLQALENASVNTDPTNQQIVRNGGPQEIQDLVKKLGTQSDGRNVKEYKLLSNKVLLISKPSNLNVPPWQMISARLDGVSLRVASWWSDNKIYTTTPSTTIRCWDSSLGSTHDLGTVEIAETGQWNGTELGLTGGQNHAKIGVSTSAHTSYSIFADMNQEGALAPKGTTHCDKSQNGRGGLFFVLDDLRLYQSLRPVLRGKTAGTKPSNND